MDHVVAFIFVCIVGAVPATFVVAVATMDWRWLLATGACYVVIRAAWGDGR